MTKRSCPLAFLLLLTTIALSSCSSRASKLPEYGQVPSFAMTDSQGRPFQADSLRGKVWVVDFIYTNCPAECPMMTARMHRVAQQLKGEDDVRLVSISVDPARDTPPVLDAFAHRFGGPTNQWTFLTGSPATVHKVAYDTFHVGDVIGKIEHSTKFILVDKRGDIRGYYSSLSSDGIPALLNDVAALRDAGILMPFAAFTIHDLPVVNAALNALATVLLLIGYTFIRQRKIDAHHRTMWTAFAVSCVFLVCYLVYHYNVGSVKFDKPGWVRTVYLCILATHTVLAATVPVLAIITLTRAQKRQFSKHKAIARWTFPIWLYVSVTGVIVYLLLYQVRPRL